MCGCMNNTNNDSREVVSSGFKVNNKECLYLKEQLLQLIPKAEKMDILYPEMMASHVLKTQIEEYDTDCTSFASWIKDNIENFTNEL